jgi:hypothetical protein
MLVTRRAFLRLASPQSSRNTLKFCPLIPLKRTSDTQWMQTMPASSFPFSYLASSVQIVGGYGFYVHTYAVTNNPATISWTSASLLVVSPNPGVSISTTRLLSSVNSSASLTSAVHDPRSIQTRGLRLPARSMSYCIVDSEFADEPGIPCPSRLHGRSKGTAVTLNQPHHHLKGSVRRRGVGRVMCVQLVGKSEYYRFGLHRGKGSDKKRKT